MRMSSRAKIVGVISVLHASAREHTSKHDQRTERKKLKNACWWGIRAHERQKQVQLWRCCAWWAPVAMSISTTSGSSSRCRMASRRSSGHSVSFTRPQCWSHLSICLDDCQLNGGRARPCFCRVERHRRRQRRRRCLDLVITWSYQTRSSRSRRRWRRVADSIQTGSHAMWLDEWENESKKDRKKQIRM